MTTTNPTTDADIQRSEQPHDNYRHILFGTPETLRLTYTKPDGSTTEIGFDMTPGSTLELAGPGDYGTTYKVPDEVADDE